MIKWMAMAIARMKQITIPLMEKVRSRSADMQKYLVDWKPILKRWKDDELDSFLNFEGKPILKDHLKELKTDMAMKRLEHFRDSIKDTGMDTSELKDMTNAIDTLTKAKNDARLQIFVRSGVAIVQMKQAGSVDQFYAEAKKAKCQMPKNLVGKLDALAAPRTPA